ncbi:MAG: phosphodiester glycosidase family protein [Thermoflexales bacterium]
MKKLPNRRSGRVALAAVLATMILGGALAFVSLSALPQLGAQGADILRKIVGDRAVAQLETFVYTTEDQIEQTLYKLGLKRVDVPWASAPPIVAAETPIETSTPAPNLAGATAATPMNPIRGEPTATAVPRVFTPPAITPFTKRADEGKWEPYILDSFGRAIAYRAFVYPDTQRPYVGVGLVAIDLVNARLGFVVGTEEPVSNAVISRTGRIPASDFAIGRLFAVFNGGFKTQHGRYGAFGNGKELVPAREGMATIALDKDGAIRIGKWGDPGLVMPDTIAWRQNGPPVVRNGDINPLTNDNSASNWGANIDGAVAVWRSGMGLSKDGQILFYVAGNDLVASTLAKSLKAAGAHNAMQLDINNFWVQFCAVRADGTALKPEPLFDNMRAQQPDRYLKAYTRDFFYVSAR